MNKPNKSLEINDVMFVTKQIEFILRNEKIYFPLIKNVKLMYFNDASNLF